MFWRRRVEVDFEEAIFVILENMHAIKKENTTVFPVEQVCRVGFEKK